MPRYLVSCCMFVVLASAPSQTSAEIQKQCRLYSSWTIARICPGQSKELVLDSYYAVYDEGTIVDSGPDRGYISQTYTGFQEGSGKPPFRGKGDKNWTTDELGRVRITLSPTEPAGTTIYYVFYRINTAGVIAKVPVVQSSIVVVLQIVPCDMKPKTPPEDVKPWQESVDDRVQRLLGSTDPAARKEAAAGLLGLFKQVQPGKRFTAARLASAVRELQAIVDAGQTPVGVADLARTIEARREVILDFLGDDAAVEDLLDTSRRQMIDLKKASPADLLDSLERAEAVHGEFLRQLAARVASPPQLDQQHAICLSVVLTQKGNGYEAHSGGDDKIAQGNIVGIYSFDLSNPRLDLTAICRVPDLLGNELRNRVGALQGEQRMRASAAANRADRLTVDVGRGISLVRHVQSYEISLRTKNAKGTADARREVERFAKDVLECVSQRKLAPRKQ